MRFQLSGWLAALPFCCISVHADELPHFEPQVIDAKVAIGYGTALEDVDGDGKLDILLADKQQFVWYRNPDWQRFVIAENLTESDNVCIAARDLDGDGRVEIAVGASGIQAIPRIRARFSTWSRPRTVRSNGRLSNCIMNRSCTACVGYGLVMSTCLSWRRCMVVEIAVAMEPVLACWHIIHRRTPRNLGKPSCWKTRCMSRITLIAGSG